MILSGKTIPQLPQLSATTNNSFLPIQLFSTTYYTTILNLIKSTPFGTFYQDLVPSSGNTFSIGSLGNKLKSIITNDVSATAITTTLINTNTVPTKGGIFAMLGDITGNTVGSGASIFVSASSANLTFRSLSSSTPNNITISTSGDLITFSAKTFITGATNNNSGSSIFQSADTQTLSFRTLSSSTPDNLTISTIGELLLFSATTTLQQAYNNSSQPEILTDSTRNALTIRNGSGANTLNIFEGQNSGSTITSFIRADGTISGSTFLGDGSQLSRYYGSFYSTSAMTAANTTTAYVMSANTTGVNSGVILSSGSRIVMQSAGTYDIKYSAQLIKTSGSPSSSTVSIWLRKNGTDIQNTNAEFDITKLTANNGKTVASFNYIDTFTAGQYVEFVWSTTSTDVTVGNIGAQTNPTRPTTPSLYVVVRQV
jgi:hypothetical protein